VSLKAEKERLEQQVKAMSLFLISLIQLHFIRQPLLHLLHNIKLRPTKVHQFPQRSLEWQCGSGGTWNGNVAVAAADRHGHNSRCKALAAECLDASTMEF
jgi:hypothetical protein